MFAAAYVAANGRVKQASGKRPVAFHGRSLVPVSADDLIPLPPGSVLSMLPDRIALAAEGPLPGAPAAALLPIGYTRTLLPAYKLSAECRVPGAERGEGRGPGAREAEAPRVPQPVELGGAREAAPTRGSALGTQHSSSAQHSFLPLFGYAAVVMQDGEPYVAAMPTDDPRPWQHPDPGYRRLRRFVRQRLAERPHSAALLAQLGHCALVYECRSAQHVFYGEGEGALPSSPVCNAACVGCISDQPDTAIQPHERLSFTPSVEESSDLAVRHLEARGSIISFGQGCEGEPLLNKQNVDVIREIRRRTSKGVININTNGSRPQMLRQLIDAGLGSIRVSMFSAREPIFRRYYKPTHYSLTQVEECLRLASQHGLFTSVNLLTFPGITDDADEVKALADLFAASGVHLVQLRNLNIDPEQLFETFQGVEFRPIGIRQMVARFREAGVEIGSYTHTHTSRHELA